MILNIVFENLKRLIRIRLGRQKKKISLAPLGSLFTRKTILFCEWPLLNAIQFSLIHHQYLIIYSPTRLRFPVKNMP